MLVLTALVAGGALMVAGIWALQRQLIYFPDATPAGPAAQALHGARDVTLRTDDGLELGAWLVPADAGRDRSWTVLVLPGNGGNRAGRAGLAERLSEAGLTVLLVDYRGYGGNPGSPSEEGLALDADAAVAFLRAEGYPAGRTIYLGESLGTAVAAALASRHPPAGMLLRSPFPELSELGAHHYPWLPVGLLLRDRFPTLDHVRESQVPLLVVRGSTDEIVPSRLSARVAEAAPVLVEDRELPGVGHNDAEMFGTPVVDAVLDLVAWIENARRGG